jgi:hypothetical protein
VLGFAGAELAGADVAVAAVLAVAVLAAVPGLDAAGEPEWQPARPSPAATARVRMPPVLIRVLDMLFLLKSPMGRSL